MAENNNTLSSMLFLKLIYSMRYNQLAEFLDISNETMSKLVSGKQNLDVLKTEKIRALHIDFPVLDPLVKSDSKIETASLPIFSSPNDTEDYIQMAELALKHATTDSMRFLCHKNLAHLLLKSSVEYTYDPNNQLGRIWVADGILQKIKFHFQALLSLSCVQPHYLPTLTRGVRLNSLGVLMLQEKKLGAFEPNSSALSGFNALLNDLIAAHSSLAKLKSKDTEIDRRLVAHLTTLIYAASATIELNLELGKNWDATNTLTRLKSCFSKVDARAIEIVVMSNLWLENRAKFQNLLEEMADNNNQILQLAA